MIVAIGTIGPRLENTANGPGVGGNGTSGGISGTMFVQPCAAAR